MLTEEIAIETEKLDPTTEIENAELETPLKRFITILFEPHFKVLIILAAYLSIVCCTIDFSFHLFVEVQISANEEDLTLPNVLFILDVFYFLDTLFMFLYKKINWFEMQVLHPPSGILLLTIDFITVIPIDVIYQLISVHDKMYIIVSLRLRYLLRSIRLFAETRRRRKTVGNNPFLGIVMEYFFVINLALFFATGIVYILLCSSSSFTCTQRDNSKFLQWCYGMSGKVTGKSFHTSETIATNVLYVCLIVSLPMYIYLKGFITSKFVNTFKQHNLPKCLFTNKALLMYNRYSELFRDDRLLKTSLQKYYASFWKERYGILHVDVKGILTEIRQSEITLDLSWKFFQHSHLFRREDLHYLHHLSCFVKKTFKSSGEVLFKKGQMKTCMIYIASGIIQFYSDEDGETPILTFSNGTCLGETSLMIRSRSTCTVVCKTDCEIDVLEARHFVNIIEKYPKRYQKSRKAIYDRFDQAKSYHKVKKFHRDFLDIRETSKLLSMKWLKMKLNTLLSQDPNYYENYINSLHINDRLLANKLNKLCFCPDFLDLLVPAKGTESVGDKMFVKSTFPCILQPDSILVRVWDKLIGIAVLLFLFIYPLYMAYFREMTASYIVFSTFITLFWALDIFIQVSTAVKTSSGLLTTMGEIGAVRLSEPLFILDIIAVVPFELLTVLITRYTEHSVLITLQINRAFKIGKLQNLFERNKDSITTNLMFITCLKCVLYLIILVYWLSAFLYVMILLDGDDSVYQKFFQKVGAHTPLECITVCIFLASVIVTGLNIYLPILREQSELFYMPLILIALIVTLLYFFLFSNITAVESIRIHENMILQQYYKDVKFVIKSLNLDRDFSQRILHYTNHQWLATNGIDFLERNQLLEDLPRELSLIIARSSLAKYAESLALFQEIPGRLLTKYCGYFTYWDIPAGQIITYAGEVASEMYIIGAGCCEIVSANGTIRRTIKPGDSFAVLETCLNIPIVHNVVTLTDCSLISLTYKDFIRASSNYPELLTDFRNIVKDTLNNWKQHKTESEEINVDLLKRKKVNKSSFIRFGYLLDSNSERGREYFLPFEKLGYFSFFRYFLLRYTIRCNGRFACYWELLRCLLTFFLVVINATPYAGVCIICTFHWLRVAVHVHSVIDIYVRHHITYYNEIGIEVTHPMKTATHYWKHSFIIDVLATFPLLWTVEKIYGKRVPIAPLRSSLRYNRLLMLYRIIKGLDYLRVGVDANVKLWTVLKYIPLIFVGLVYTTGICFNLNCRSFLDYPPTKIFGSHLLCKEHNWIGYPSDFIKPIGLYRAIGYHFYYVTSITTSIGLHGFYIVDFLQLKVIIVLCFIGFLCFEYISAKIIAVNLSRNVNLTVYQEGTSVLMKFLNMRPIDEKLKKELVEHFEYVFLKLRGIRYETVFSKYSNALKEEAMYKIFGSVMKESYVFQGANPSFFRSLFLHVNHQIILRHGIITRVNDVTSKIFFIFDGEVEVLGPDYNRLLILPKGSLFGNLDDVSYSRRTLTMVAKGHVEVLKITTKDFYTVLNRYGNLKTQFKKMTMLNTDYLAGGPLPKIVKTSKKQQEQTKSNWRHLHANETTMIGRFIHMLISIHSNTRMIKIWDAFILIIICFFGCIVDLYRIIVDENALSLTILLYIFDFLYIVKIYIKFHTTYRNKNGVYIKERRLIAKHYIRKKSGFILDLLTVIPFEVVAFAFSNWTIYWKILIYCRGNRFLRLFFVLYYFHTTNKKISINVYRVKTLQMMVYIILTLQTATALVVFLGCYGNTNTHPEMICDRLELSSKQKFEYFAVQLGNVISIFTGISFRKYYPNSITMVCVLISYMLLCRITIMIFMAQICATWEVIQHTRNVYEHTIIKYKKLVTIQKLSPVLIEKTWRYFRLLWGKQSGIQFPLLLEKAPYYLREATLNSMFGHHIHHHPTLKLCHVDLIRQMAARMRTRVFFPGDYIAFKDDIDDCMYFVHSGEILGLSVDTLKTEVIDVVYKEKDMFGLNQGMYRRVGHEFTYRANQYSILVVLKRIDWIHLLNFYPASKELIYNENFNTSK